MFNEKYLHLSHSFVYFVEALEKSNICIYELSTAFHINDHSRLIKGLNLTTRPDCAFFSLLRLSLPP